MRYFDLDEDLDKTGYSATNEDPAILRGWVSELMPRRTLAIAGGGESIYLGVLPVSGRVAAVDWSYRACFITFLKGILLEKYGPDIKHLIRDSGKFIRVLKKQVSDVPDDLVRNAGYTTNMGGGEFFPYDYMVDVWTDTPDDFLGKASEKLDDLTIFHMNFVDIQNPLGYDFAYTSNARTDNLARLVKLGGHVFSSGSTRDENLCLRRQQQNRPGGWIYSLYERVE